MPELVNDNQEIENEQDLKDREGYAQDIQNHTLILNYSAAYKLPRMLIPTDYIIQVGFSQI